MRHIIITLIILISINAFAKEKSIRDFKDPVMAGVLSWYSPGMGQIYSGHIERGAIFFAAEWTMLLTALFVVVDINFAFGGSRGVSLSFTEKKEDWGKSVTRKSISLSLLGAALILHIFNVFDAIRLAKKYNHKLRIKLFLNKKEAAIIFERHFYI